MTHMFEQRHFEAIANEIHRAWTDYGRDPTGPGGGVNALEIRLEQLFMAANPHFDPKRFYKACVEGVRPQ